MKYNLESLPPNLKRKEKRDSYASECVKEINSGVQARNGLLERWKTNEDNLRNVSKSAVELVPGAVPYPIPLVQPMLDRINGTVYGNITAVEPWVQVTPEMDDMGVGEMVERDLQFLMARAQFPRKLWSALKITSCTNCALLRLRYVNTVGFEIDVVHPGDAMIYPSSAQSPAQAKSFGHRFFLTVSQIKERQKAGTWIDCDVAGSDDPQQYDSGRSKQHNKVESGAANPLDESLELWEIVRREDMGGGPMWYKCVVALRSQQLLECTPFGAMVQIGEESQFIPYSGPDYIDLRYDDEYGIFWPSGCPAQNLQGIQAAYSDAFNIWYWGNVASSFPSLVISGGSLGKKVEKLVPGAIIEVPGGPINVQIVGVNFNGQSFVPMLEKLEDVAQRAVRNNQLSVGQNLKSHTTATEASGLMEMQRQADDQYTAFISLGLQRLFIWAYELYRIHHADILNTFGPSIEVQDPMMLEALRFNFECNGKHSSNSPQALVQKLQMLLAMSADPKTTFDYAKVEQAVARALQLPFSVAKVTITPEQAAQNLLGAAQGAPLDDGTKQALGSLDPNAMAGVLSAVGGMAPNQGMAA